MEGHQDHDDVFSGVFIFEGIDGVGDKGSGDNTTADVRTFSEAFLNISPKCASCSTQLLCGKKQNIWSWDYCPKALDYKDFQIIGHWMEEILL